MKQYIIVAVCNNLGIGKNNQLVWDIKDDMKHFMDTTKNHICVMGRNTYFSIPQKNRPLKNRINIVLTSNPDVYKFECIGNDNLVFCTYNNLDKVLKTFRKFSDTCFIIGGESVYNEFLDKVDGIFITRIEKDYDCDSFFPTFEDKFALVEKSDLQYSTNEDCRFWFEKYDVIAE
jgi:dihydrofolate reductase